MTGPFRGRICRAWSEVSRFPVSSIYRPVSAGTIIVCYKSGTRGVRDIERFIFTQNTTDLLISTV